MSWHTYLTFSIATLGETLIPGPTLALVLAVRSEAGATSAARLVFGISAANIVWVLVAIVGGSWLSTHAVSLTPYVQGAGAGYLVHLATRHTLRAAGSLASGMDNLPSQPNAAPRTLFLTGFLAHLLNPSVVFYYAGTFATASLNRPTKVAALLGVIAILSDAVVYGTIASNAWLVPRNIPRPIHLAIRFATGAALLYLVALSCAGPPATTLHLALSPLSTEFMLLGLLSGILLEAVRFVWSRRGQDNRRLWRVIALWQANVSAVAVLGAFYAFVAKGFRLSEVNDNALRISAVVAAAGAMGLSFAKAYGELADELEPAKERREATSRTEPRWAERVGGIWSAIILFFAVLFGFLVWSKFMVQ